MPKTLRKWVKKFCLRSKNSCYAQIKVGKLIFTSNSDPGKAVTSFEKPILETSLNACFCTIINYKLKYQLIFLLRQYHNLDQDTDGICTSLSVFVIANDMFVRFISYKQMYQGK